MYVPLTLPDAATWMRIPLMLCVNICGYSRPLWMLSAAARNRARPLLWPRPLMVGVRLGWWQCVVRTRAYLYMVVLRGWVGHVWCRVGWFVRLSSVCCSDRANVDAC